MWIPTPIYDRVPQFWLLLGLLFMSSGTYLGFDYALTKLYFGAGLVCCLWSLWIFAMRLRNRKALKAAKKNPLPDEENPAKKQQPRHANSLGAGFDPRNTISLRLSPDGRIPSEPSSSPSDKQ
jgi:hypothetical protein